MLSVKNYTLTLDILISYFKSVIKVVIVPWLTPLTSLYQFGQSDGGYSEGPHQTHALLIIVFKESRDVLLSSSSVFVPCC